MKNEKLCIETSNFALRRMNSAASGGHGSAREAQAREVSFDTWRTRDFLLKMGAFFFGFLKMGVFAGRSGRPLGFLCLLAR